jgi:hypothetical protein
MKMEKNRLLMAIQFLVCFLFLVSSLPAQSDFEGKIIIEIDAASEKSVLNYCKKDNYARIEVTGDQTGIMIFKPDKTIMIMPTDKIYMEFNGSLLDMAEKYGGGDAAGGNLKDAYSEIDKYKTGEFKLIKGYNCEKYYKADKLNETEMWVTEELGKFLFINPDRGDSWMSEIANKNFFPMLVISKEKKSGEISRLEVTDVLEKNLEDDLFEVPAGYQKMTMPGIQE